MWADVIRYDEVTSTNDLALDHARRGVREGTVVVARYQAAGRGRQGREWVAPPGQALLASIIVYPGLALARSAWLTLLAGVAAAEAVRDLTHLEARLKWPNDVLLDERKLGGVLTETHRARDGVAAIVGIGLNCLQEADDFPPELRDTATSLKLAGGREWPLNDLLELLTNRYRDAYLALRDGSIEPLRRRWSELDLTIGREVVVDSPNGEWEGRASSIDENGALWIETAVGDPRRVVAGDVSLKFAE